MLQRNNPVEEAVFRIELDQILRILAGAQAETDIRQHVAGDLLLDAVHGKRKRGFGERGAVVIVVVDFLAVLSLGGESQRADRVDIEPAVKAFRPAVARYHVVDEHAGRLVGHGAIVIRDAADVFKAFGISEGHPGQPRPEAARIDAQDHAPGGVVIVIFSVECRGGGQGGRVFLKRIHDSDAARQGVGEMQGGVERDDSLGYGWGHGDSGWGLLMSARSAGSGSERCILLPPYGRQ